MKDCSCCGARMHRTELHIELDHCPQCPHREARLDMRGAAWLLGAAAALATAVLAGRHLTSSQAK